MPVYRQSRLIHIPKTGGTAIESFFHSIDDMVWGLDSWLGQEYIDNRWYEFQHLSILEFLTFTAGEFRQFNSFAVIRNPYSRLISEFLWRHKVGRQRPGAPMLFYDSFTKFLQDIPQEIDKNWPLYLENADQAKTNYLIHVRPQYQYVYSQNGEQIVKELLRFEELKTEFSEAIVGPPGATVVAHPRFGAVCIRSGPYFLARHDFKILVQVDRV